MDPLAGHLATVLVLIGTWMVARDRHLGWALRAAGNLTWFMLGLDMQVSAIWFWEGAASVVDLHKLWGYCADNHLS